MAEDTLGDRSGKRRRNDDEWFEAGVLVNAMAQAYDIYCANHYIVHLLKSPRT